ncbi:hypothetical protein HMPREF9374_3420 [Desmospora sp. 8437]|nr:hypothetical protein HMPREF9374_3420 [Desmospora sp. 8437]
MKKALLYLFPIFSILSLVISVSSYIFNIEFPGYIESIRELLTVSMGFFVIFIVMKNKE